MAVTPSIIDLTAEAREADDVPRPDATVDNGGSQGKRRTIGLVPRRRPHRHEVRGQRSLGIGTPRATS